MKKRRSRSDNTPEQLEQRTLLTVNVTFKPGSGLLTLKGDSAGDSVLVDYDGAQGKVKVKINNVESGSFEGVKSIKADLGAGDDNLSLQSLDILGNITAKMGSGEDSVQIHNVNNNPTIINGSVKIDFGGDANDALTMVKQILIIKNLIVTGVSDVELEGTGNDWHVQLGDINVLKNCKITMGVPSDENADTYSADIHNLNVSGKFTFMGSNDAEQLHFRDNLFKKSALIKTGNGANNIFLDNGPADANNFQGAAKFIGGIDTDTVFRGLDNLFASTPSFTNIEIVL